MLHKHITNKNHWTMQRAKKNKIKKSQIRDPVLYPKLCGSIIWAFHIPVWWDIKREGKEKKQPREEETSCYGGTEHVADESRTVFKETQASGALACSRLLHAALSLMSLPVKPGLCGCLSRSNHGPPALSTSARSALFTSPQTAVNNTNEWINVQMNVFS